MEKIKMDGGGLVCIERSRLQLIRGGTSVACLQGVWDYVQKALGFIKEYHQEIIKGFKKGWNKF